MILKRHYILSLVLSICVLLETLALTYMQQEYGAFFYYFSSIIYFFSGLAICIIPIIPLNNTGKSFNLIQPLNRSIPYLVCILFAILIGYYIVHLIPIYRSIKIDKNWADMLPTITVACQRFLHCKSVYGPAPEIWDGAIISYFTMMWAPFLPAEIFNFDYRWITIAFQFSGTALAFIPLFTRWRNMSFISTLIALTGLFLFYNYFVMKRSEYWSMTEEGVVAGWYMLLSFALLRKNYWLIGLAIMACALSRYSLVFWIPVYFSYVFFTQLRSDFWKLFLSFSISMLLLFIIPFFIKDPWYFIHIPIAYTHFYSGFWISQRIDEHLFFNVGLFKFFTLSTHNIMGLLQIASSFSIPIIFIIIALRLKKSSAINEKYIAFTSLKISLVFFFAFIQMPYLYIFVPVTLISYILLFDYLALQNSKPIV